MKYSTVILFVSIFCGLISSTIWAVQDERGKLAFNHTPIHKVQTKTHKSEVRLHDHNLIGEQKQACGTRPYFSANAIESSRLA